MRTVIIEKLDSGYTVSTSVDYQHRKYAVQTFEEAVSRANEFLNPGKRTKQDEDKPSGVRGTNVADSLIADIRDATWL